MKIALPLKAANFFIANKYQYRITNTHVFFWIGLFSQWYPSFFTIEDQQYNCAEQWMMAQKARLFNDANALRHILASDSPKEMQLLGRGIVNFNPILWDAVKYETVLLGNYAKFAQNKDLLAELLKVGDRILVEGSPYDKIWGVGIAYDNPIIDDEQNWQGQNLLGKALTEVKNSIK